MTKTLDTADGSARGVAILGSGAVGCHLGLSWAEPLARIGAPVTLIGRARLLGPLRDRAGATVTFATEGEGAAALGRAGAIVLAVKATALEAAAEEIARHARPEVPVVCLLNGLEPVRRLRARFPDRTVLAGMVPFNVVWQGSDLHRTGQGTVAMKRHPLTNAWRRVGVDITLHDDLAPVQRGKLLLNLVGAVNALSGLSLHATLANRGYRRVFAASLSEALRIYRAAGLSWEAVGSTDPRIGAVMLRAPDWVFERVVLRRQGLDPASMTSMAGDLAAGRPTEIDTIHGEVLRIAAAANMQVPVNSRLTDLMRAVEAGDRKIGLPPEELLREVGLGA